MEHIEELEKPDQIPFFYAENLALCWDKQGTSIVDIEPYRDWDL